MSLEKKIRKKLAEGSGIGEKMPTKTPPRLQVPEGEDDEIQDLGGKRADEDNDVSVYDINPAGRATKMKDPKNYSSNSSSKVQGDDDLPRGEKMPTTSAPKVRAEDLQLDAAMEKLTEGVDLTEEYQTKMRTIFEAICINTINENIKKYVSEINEEVEDFIDDYKEDLEEKVDTYLTYVVKEWVEENKLAIETGVRLEKADKLINGLSKLFTECNVKVEGDEVRLVEEQNKRISILERQLNESKKVLAESYKKDSNATRAGIVASYAAGMTDSQTEKFIDLCEGVEFKSKEEYEKKVSIIKESLFTGKKTPKLLTEEDMYMDDEDMKDMYDSEDLDDEISDEDMDVPPELQEAVNFLSTKTTSQK